MTKRKRPDKSGLFLHKNYRNYMLFALSLTLAIVSFALTLTESLMSFNFSAKESVVFFPSSVPKRYQAAAPIATPASNRAGNFELFVMFIGFRVFINKVFLIQKVSKKHKKLKAVKIHICNAMSGFLTAF